MRYGVLSQLAIDMVFPAWPGGHALERMHAGDAALRAALADALRQRTKGLTFPSMPPGFDAGQFVLGKVRPMVCGAGGDTQSEGIMGRSVGGRYA